MNKYIFPSCDFLSSFLKGIGVYFLMCIPMDILMISNLLGTPVSYHVK